LDADTTIPNTELSTSSAKKRRLSDVFWRLIGLKGMPGRGKLDVRVALLVGEAGLEHSKRIVSLLNKQGGIRAKLLKKELDLDAEMASDEQIKQASFVARNWLQSAGGDLLIWGEAPLPSTTLNLRFISAEADSDDRPGAFGFTQTLHLPADIKPELLPVLLLTTFAAMDIKEGDKATKLREGLNLALEEAMPILHALPADLTARERAAIQFCAGKAIAKVAQFQASLDLYQTAAKFLIEALAGIKQDEAPFAWAMAHMNIGMVMQALIEKGDTETMDQTVESYRSALKHLTKFEYPKEWAICNHRMGQVLYKLERESGDTEMLKHALTSYQSAIQVFTRADYPEVWAEIMNDFALAAQILGEHLRNPEVTQSAIDACRSALEVRTRNTHPLWWAATKNNLGSALFMLAKQGRGTEELEESAEVFAEVRDLYEERKATRQAAIAEKNLGRVVKLLEKRGSRGVPKMKWEQEAERKEEARAGAAVKEAAASKNSK
jgi:tetratricopeptide (TPR) repeat protein